MLLKNGLNFSLHAALLCMAFMLTSPSFAERINATTIEDSLAAGLQHSNVISASRQAFVLARQSSGQATSANDLTGRFAFSGSNIQTDSKANSGGFIGDNSLVGSLTLSKRLYDSGEANTKLDIAELDIQIARENYQLTEQSIIFEVISSHLAVLTAQKAFDIRNANERRLQAHTKAAKIRLEAGTSTPTGLAESEARLARAQSDKIIAEANLQSALEAYQSLTGLNVETLKGFDVPKACQARWQMLKRRHLYHIPLSGLQI